MIWTYYIVQNDGDHSYAKNTGNAANAQTPYTLNTTNTGNAANAQTPYTLNTTPCLNADIVKHSLAFHDRDHSYAQNTCNAQKPYAETFNTTQYLSADIVNHSLAFNNGDHLRFVYNKIGPH